MSVYIFGDSITRGHYGIDYSRYLDSSFQVKGWDGSTLLQIFNFSTRYFERIEESEKILFLGGANDIIYTYLSLSQNGWSDYIHSRKNLVTSISTWKEKVNQKISSILSAYPKNLLYLSTIALEASFGNTELMELTHQYNDAIKNIASKFSLSILDLFKEFNTVLKTKDVSNYIAVSPESLQKDALYIEGNVYTAEDVSNSRGLFLSVDGIHPNNEGALCIARAIKNIFV